MGAFGGKVKRWLWLRICVPAIRAQVITANQVMLSRRDLGAVGREHTDFIRSRTVYLAPRSAMVQVIDGNPGEQTG